MSDGMTLLARCLVKCQYSGYWPLVATILLSRFEYKHAASHLRHFLFCFRVLYRGSGLPLI